MQNLRTYTCFAARIAAIFTLAIQFAKSPPARSCEPDQELAIPMVDCHVHLWTTERPEGISWLAKDNKVLYRSFLPEEYARIARANNVQAVVVVQAGQSIADNQWNLDITASDKQLYRGVIGNLSKVIGTDEFKSHFDSLCNDKRYVGYRLSGRYQKTLTDDFFRDLALTAERGKVVEFLAGDYNLTEILEIAQKTPKLKIVLDHFGNVRLAGKTVDILWASQMEALSKCENVMCKVSALYGRVAQQPAPQDIAYYKPLLDATLKWFGEDRLIFGSDWPVIQTTGDYASVIKLTKEYFDTKERGVSEKLFYKNAMKLYSLGELTED